MKRPTMRQRLIRARLLVLGHTHVRVWWEPIGPALEMCGYSGGFFFSSDEYSTTPIGLSLDEALSNLNDSYAVPKQCKAGKA